MRSNVRTGAATARGGVVWSGLQRVREECQTSGRDSLPPDAPDPPAKNGNFFGASWRWGFRKEPAGPAGVAEPTHGGNTGGAGVGGKGGLRPGEGSGQGGVFGA